MNGNELRPETRWLLDQFDDCLAGLIHYGSTAFGQARRGSACDFWLIVSDLRKFHSRFKPMPCGISKGRDSVEKRVEFNRGTPNFYSIELDGMRMKLAVVDADTFCDMSNAPSYYIKGRMQKPVNIIKAEPRILRAIERARDEAAQWALDLLPRRFTFDDFLHAALGLSYRTEIRPEFKQRKVQSIIDTGRGMLDEMYKPLLENRPDVVKEADGGYRDARDEVARRYARIRAVRELRRLKWSREAFRHIYQNYVTYNKPIFYLVRKVLGEFEKIFRAMRGASRAADEQH